MPGSDLTLFPHGGQSIQPTSCQTSDYNCLAWVIHVTDRWVWPDEDEQFAWPENVAREETAEAFGNLLELAGYESCPNGNFEPGYEKIAIFVDDNSISHAARSMANGRWTSKFGDGIDAEHPTPETISAGVYGWPARYFRKAGFQPPDIPDLYPPPQPPPLIIFP